MLLIEAIKMRGISLEKEAEWREAIFGPSKYDMVVGKRQNDR